MLMRRKITIGVPNIPQFEAALRQAIEGVSGVERVVALSTVVQDGTLFYAAEILTTEGQTAIDGNFTI